MPHGLRNLPLERRLGDWTRALLPAPLSEFVMFVLKQGWACLFGGLMLAALILTSAVWQDDWPVHRYDALLVFALGTQVLFLALKLETPAEARVILLFHLTGTAMELFKVNAGSWSYPEPALTKLWGVPLFSGFMYAAVGSYIARVIRLFDMTFAPMPPIWTLWALGAATYANFFAHHYLPDIRLGLFAATVILFGRTRVGFTVGGRYWMPMPLAALLTALALWIAENVGTATGTWLYSGQLPGQMVSLHKLGSWYLLLWVCLATVTLVSREAFLSSGPRAPVVGPRRQPT